MHTWTEDDPSAMNSAASRQLEMPPMPEIGSFPIWGWREMPRRAHAWAIAFAAYAVVAVASQ